ncbi:hypothetical protein Cgig2_000226 [Carnegiea gigantea]|uniref:AAA+ ATPase domain-containing protein n=1 Tax=Carnegiea gigantea TaxID=171969 RepID=A0A9Q1Q6H7_9CARY|nr:hypothetical protein Cgig2_000226 [Carnegiea gigantea]
MTMFDMALHFGSLLASAMFFSTIYQHYVPARVRKAIEMYTYRYTHKLANFFSPYLTISFDEYTSDSFCRSEVYTTIENYLNDKSSMEARGMKADYIEDGKSLLLSLDENEEIVDHYHGRNNVEPHRVQAPCKIRHAGRGEEQETNDNSGSTMVSGCQRLLSRNREAMEEGYLLYGPPRTGKSTLVAAMANLLEYDIYDLELTAVKNNMQLRRLLIETSSKWIILIEDIDCSLELTGKRKKKKANERDNGKDSIKNRETKSSKKKGSQVTVSAILNFIDGIWSACGEERIIVFITNHIDKIDPSLIRRGRIDVHIELSYCCFESFKVLAKNYLRLKSHLLFETIRRSLEETQMTPADMAENLMPTSINVSEDTCLENLIKSLEKAREESKLTPVKEMMSEEETEDESSESSTSEEEESSASEEDQ